VRNFLTSLAAINFCLSLSIGYVNGIEGATVNKADFGDTGAVGPLMGNEAPCKSTAKVAKFKHCQSLRGPFCLLSKLEGKRLSLLLTLPLFLAETGNGPGFFNLSGFAEFSIRGFVYICKRHTSLRNASTILAKLLVNSEIKLQNSSNFYDATAQHHIQH